MKLWRPRSPAIVMSCILLAFSAYFAIQIELDRARVKSGTALFASGDLVRITSVVDGDELAVETAFAQARVRLLGIQAFDPRLADEAAAAYGKNAVDALRSGFVGKTARLDVNDPPRDRHGRLLARLFADVEGRAAPVDVGLDLVAQGLAIVFTRYEQESEAAYQAVQNQARLARRGLWANDALAARVATLQDAWLAERLADD